MRYLPRQAPNGGRDRDLPGRLTRRRRAQALPTADTPRPARLPVDRAGGMRQYGEVMADVTMMDGLDARGGAKAGLVVAAVEFS